ncbi:MAG TPA: 4-hydroxythreonine-4-phosphate dehydrogenase PdxA [Bryobacteraceae bacterium]|jgi:4-hydroxythreonine-4-phosphate dehydrogenase
MPNLPRIAITMGDAAGVGPEIVMKSLAHAEVYEVCKPLVIGDAERLREAGRICGSILKVPGDIECVDLKLIPKDLAWGRLSAEAGDAAFHFVKLATKLAMEGRVDAICTAPLNKEALHAGGHFYPGHTELLAALTGTPEVSMMLTAPSHLGAHLRVIHVTAHMGLLDAIARIEPGLVERTITRGHGVLRRAGLTRLKIGVCGINPHAGENGLFGRGEEESKIAPAIAACRAKGIDAEGPLPADTLFYRAARGDFDMVVAMYHDQGHGPVKVLGLEAGVNITVGLPVIRTSVDHGTAFDIAGTGRADERSMLEALRQAAELAGTK